MVAMADLVTVDRTSPVPLYFQVAQALQHHIEEGHIASGSLLGNEIGLADDLGVSRPTMRKAIEYLVQRGLLVRKRGVGTQVVRAQVRRPLQLTETGDKFDILATVAGGGVNGQAGAVRLGIARALVEFNAELRKQLKKDGLLTSDSRVKERKKYGLAGARKRFQFSKR